MARRSPARDPRGSATLVAIAAAALLVGSVSASRASDAGTAAEVTARLTPAALGHRPSGVRPRARGTFRATIWPTQPSWDVARFWLRTAGLTGPVQTAHVHTGAPGKNGPVLVTLCDGGRCSLTGTGYRAIPAGTVEALEVLGGYVDVHTKRNPRGELRGQVVISP